MDEAFIVVSIISTIGMLAGVQLVTHNWFKKQRFKFELDQTKKVDSIKLKSLERKLLGVNSGSLRGKTPVQSNIDTGMGGIGKLLDLAKDNPELAHEVLDRAIGGELDLGDVDSLGGLIEVGKPIIEGLLKAKNEGQQTNQNTNIYES